MADQPLSAETRDAAVERAVARVTSTQARCGTKLMQVPADFVWPGSRFEADDVDVAYLVRDILDAAQSDGPGASGGENAG